MAVSNEIKVQAMSLVRDYFTKGAGRAGASDAAQRRWSVVDEYVTQSTNDGAYFTDTSGGTCPLVKLAHKLPTEQGSLPFYAAPAGWTILIVEGLLPDQQPGGDAPFAEVWYDPQRKQVWLPDACSGGSSSDAYSWPISSLLLGATLFGLVWYFIKKR
jgi:hypothetical protein